jgi:pyroglutamyl-peptidase
MHSQAKPSGSTKLQLVLTKPYHCLVTGFDAFGDALINPSEILVESLPEELKLPKRKEKLALHTMVLPTCGEDAWVVLEAALREVPADEKLVLVITGWAAKRRYISLERFALNIRDYRIKDNGGYEWNGEQIDKDGPEALRTTVAIEAIAKTMNRKGYPTEISNHAGTFVCNETYYRALSICQKLRRDASVLFVHIPSPSIFAKTIRDKEIKRMLPKVKGKSNQEHVLRDAVLSLVEQICSLS